MKPRLFLPALAAAALLVSCPGDDGGVANVLVVASVDVAPGLVDVILGQTEQLTASPKTSSGIAVPGRTVAWSTTDASIASVSGSGLVTGKALGGPVRIRATVDGVTGDALVTVRPVPVDHVTVEPPAAGVLVNGSFPLTAKAFDAGNVELLGRSFLWQSSNTSVAAVTTDGVVIGLAEGGPVTVSATSEGKTAGSIISVSTRPPTRLGFAQQPGLAIAGQPMTPPVRVALQDDLLSTVTGAGNPVTIALAGNPGGATLSGQRTVNALNGIATFSDLSLDRVGTAYTFLVTSPGLSPATSTPFDVTAGSANRLAFATAPAATAQSGLALAQQPVLQLRDGSGNAVAQAGLVITASIASGPAGASLGGSVTATTTAAGVATFTTLTLSGPVGSYTLAFGSPSLTSLTSGSITLAAGAAAALAFGQQPSATAQSNTPLPQQPILQLLDAAGNNVAQAGVTVTAAIASGGGAVAGNISAVTDGSGRATFAGLSISGPAGTYSLEFSAPGVSAVISGPIVLGAGGATQLVIVTQPSATAASGAVLGQQPVVRLRDASGNNVAQAGVSIGALVSAGGTLLGTITRLTDATGVASFTDLAISGLVGSYTLTFVSLGLVPTPQSTPIALTPGPAAQLTYDQQPSIAAQSGVAFVQQPILQLRDAAGNAVPQGGVLVTATLTGSPAGVALIGTLSVTTTASGIASFVGSGLGLNGLAGSYTLTFTAGALSSSASNAIALSAGGASQITYNQQPSTTANSGQPLAQQPILLLRDAASNPIANVVITASITGAPAGVTLIGTLTATTNASGIASFVGSGLGLAGPVGSYTLAFTAGAVSSTASNSIVLSAGTATQLTYTQQPSATATSGQALAQQPILLVRDGANNPVANVVVTATVTGAPAGVSRIGTTTATTNASGVATFVGSGLGLSGPVGTYSLTFTAGALGSAASSAIVLSAGTPTQLSINTQPSASASSGVAFGTVPVLLVRDAANNPVNNVVVTATITGSPAGVAFVGTATATSNASGLATFTGLGLSGPAGNYTLTFTAGALSSGASSSIALSAGAGTQLTYSQQPASSASSGQAFATQPALLLLDASNNPVPGAVVTATITGSPAGVTFVGTPTATTNGAGLATFSGLGLSGPVGTYTLTCTSGAATSAASTSIALGAGTATQLTINTQPPASASSGVAFGTVPVLLLRDAAGNPVAGVSVTATLTGSPAGVSFVGSATASTNSSGLATFATLGLSGPAGSYTLTFTAGALSSGASTTIALSAGGGTQLTYTQQPSTSATSGQAFATQPILLLRDASSNPVPGVLVTASITGAPGGASLIGTASVTTDGAGSASFAGTGLGVSALAGNYTLTFSTGTATSVASSTIAVSAGTPTQLTYNTQPSSGASSGQPFATAPVLLLRDAAGNPITNAVITATITGAPAGVSFVGTATATTNASGLASFAGLGLSGPSGSYTLTFTAGALTSAASNSITLAAGGGTQLTFNQQPSPAANSGQALATQPVLLLQDAFNTPVAGATVTAAITGAPPGASLANATATTDISGLATFSGLTLSGPVGSYTLTFTSGAATSAPSAAIVLSAGTPTQLSYNAQPSSSAVSGAAFGSQPVLLLRDGENNPVDNVVVTATITGSPAGVSFVGTATATTSGAGLASFSGLGLSGPAGSYTLTFTAGSVISPASNSIALSAGGGTLLSYTQQPSTIANSGVAFAQQPVLLLQDASNNPVPGILVTAAITGSPAGAALIGTTSATTDGTGLASFPGLGLGLSAPAGNYTLTFSTGTATSVASHTIALGPGPATQLTYSTQPSSSATSNQVFPTQPVLLLRDSGNNPIVSTVVTATITGVPAGVSLIGTATATTDGSGIATFSGLGLNGLVGNYTLTFTSGAVSSPASNNIVLSAGAASQLSYSTQPSSSVASGQAFATQPVLLLQDAGGNPIGASVITATITGAPAGASLVGTATATTTGSGLASFSGLGLSALVGNYTLTFTAGSVTSLASNSIAVATGSATQLSYNTQPSSVVASGQAFATAPVLLLRDSGNNPVGGTVVSATITGSPAGVSFVGTATATTDGAGLATFAGLGLNGPAGNYSLTFTAGPVTSAASNSIALGTGPATQLSYNTQPSSSAASDQAFGTSPVLLLRDSGGNPVGGTVVTATITGSPGGVSLLGTPTATTDGAGLATFTGLGLSGPVGSYSLTFTAGALTSGPSNTITLGAGAPALLTYAQQPSSSAASGVAFGTPPVLLLQDASNNPVTGTLVTATATGAPAGVSFVGTPTATTDGSGLATFTGLGLNAPAGNYTLTFTVGALSSAASSSIAVATGPATQLSYTTQPSAAANSGLAFGTQPALLLQDSGGNPVGGTVVTATITGSPAGVALVGTVTATTDPITGIASFVDVGLSGTAATYTLTFTANAGALSSPASGSIVLSAGPATQLVITTQPVGGSITTQNGLATKPILEIQDAQGNRVTGDNTTQVTVTIFSGTGGTLGGTQTVTAVNGVIDFAGLTLTGIPVTETYVLQFTANPALTAPTSNGVTLTP